MLSNHKQPWNAHSSILVTVHGIAMLSKELQLRNAANPIYWRPSLNFTSFRPLQFTNMESVMLETVEGIDARSKEQQL